MSTSAGRIMGVAVLCLGLVLLFMMGLHQAGFGRNEALLAKEAVAATIQQAAQQSPPPSYDPPLKGRDASPEEAAALDRTVDAFLSAVRARNAKGSWEMVDPERSGGLGAEAWESYLTESGEKSLKVNGEEALTIFMGQQARVAETKVAGDTGVCRVIVTLNPPQWLALVRRGQGWALDLESSNNLQAFHDVGQQLSFVSSDDPTGFFRALIGMEGGGPWNDYLRLLVLTPGTSSHRIVARKVDGDHAVVKLQGHAELHLAVAIKRGPNGWAPDWRSGDIQTIEPDKPLPADVAGGVGGPRSMACLSNLKQLELAMLMYAQDYDERFAPANKWTSGIMPYTKNEQAFRCPAVPDKPGYAMNYKLSRAPLATVAEPSGTVCFFDSTLFVWDAYDKGKQPGDSIAWPPRHDEVVNYGFVDGHVKSQPEHPLPYPEFYQVVRTGPLPPTGPGGPPGAPPGAPAGGG